MFVKKSKAKVFSRPTCTVYEYGGTTNLDLAVGEIKGRYPEKGWVRNTKVDETYFVIVGKGKVYLEKEIFEVNEGDLVMIEKNKWYRAEGNLTVVIACSPPWSPGQYEEREE